MKAKFNFVTFFINFIGVVSFLGGVIIGFLNYFFNNIVLGSILIVLSGLILTGILFGISEIIYQLQISNENKQ